MRKVWKRIRICIVLTLMFCGGAVLTGKTALLPSPEAALSQLRQDTTALTDSGRMTAYLQEKLPVLAETARTLNLGWLGGNWWFVQFPNVSMPGLDSACAAPDTAESPQVEIRFAVVDLWNHMKNLLTGR